MSRFEEMKAPHVEVPIRCILWALRSPVGEPERALTSHEIFNLVELMAGDIAGISYAWVMYCIGILVAREEIEAVDWPENLTPDYDKLHWRIKAP